MTAPGDDIDGPPAGGASASDGRDDARLPGALEAAWATRADLRAALADEGTDCLRAFDGRHEGAPGWVVDRFGPAWLVTRLGAEAAPGPWLDALPDGPVVLKDRARPDGVVVRGHLDGPLVVTEAGLRFEVDLLRGRSPGLFTDARAFRRAVRARVAGLRVLNLFSYTAAFGVAALAGGARSVENVDAVPSTHARGQRNYALNGFDDPRAFVRAEVTEHLRRARSRGRRWDLVICDPPPVRSRQGPRGRRRGFDPGEWPTLWERLTAVADAVLAVSAVPDPSRFEDVVPTGASLLRDADHPGPPRDGARARWIDTPSG